MAGARIQRKPAFLWQAALILLPVAVLAVVGGLSVRQDKILIQHDAVERAQAIADALVPRIWNELARNNTNPFDSHSFQTDGAGRLLFPPDYAPVPIPKPFDLAELSAEQSRFWSVIQKPDDEASDFAAVNQAYTNFINSNPPEDFAAAACYGLGLLLVRHEKFPEAAEMFDWVQEKYPNAAGESGLPLWPLAQFKLVELEPHQVPHPAPHPVRSPNSRVRSQQAYRPWPVNGIAEPYPAASSLTLEHFVSLDSFCSNIIYHPTPLTAYFLEALREQADDARPIVRTNAGSIGISSSLNYTDTLQRSAHAREVTEALAKWQHVWGEHEASRQLYSAARRALHTNASLRPTPALLMRAIDRTTTETQTATIGSFAPGANIAASADQVPRLFWFTTPAPLNLRAEAGLPSQVEDRKWLAVRLDDNATNHWFACHGESELGFQASDLVKGERQIPEYFGIGIDLASERLTAFAPDLRVWHHVSWFSDHSPGGGVKKEYSTELATKILASAARWDGETEQLRASVFLTSPMALFEHQQARAFWFGSLVVASTAAAMIGLFTAGRAFRQQLQLSEMKSNFVSSVSHELRAPIASVRLMAESLERGKIAEPQKQNEYFRFIVQECRRLSSLIENVLDFSRIEQGRKQYEFEPTNLVMLVNQTVALMQPCAAEKGVNLIWGTSNIEHPTSNIELNVDGKAIQQALVNLIDNALKHSPKGETVKVGIEVSDRRSEDGGRKPEPEMLDASRITHHDAPFKNQERERSQESIHHPPSTIHLSVSDHGPGIPPEEHEKIFERFYRRGSELRRETQGVGIGLSIVKHIVEAHGGRVIVRSAAGAGSRFTIELPIQP
jgi:signal transduction histidine kinase